jgi:hypothetical protein
MNSVIATAVALSALALTGCASIVSGTNQPVTVDTPSCPAASCKLTNDKGTWAVTTPGSVTVSRAYGPMTVVCSKEGFESATATFASSTKGMAFGNVVFGGLIGAGVDVASGAAYDYPNAMIVAMACTPATQRQAPAAPEAPVTPPAPAAAPAPATTSSTPTK